MLEKKAKKSNLYYSPLIVEDDNFLEVIQSIIEQTNKKYKQNYSFARDISHFLIYCIKNSINLNLSLNYIKLSKTQNDSIEIEQFKGGHIRRSKSTVKIGRFIVKLLEDNSEFYLKKFSNDKNALNGDLGNKISEFVDYFKYVMENKLSENSFELVKGEKIRKCYLIDNYSRLSISSTLTNSCMAHRRCQPYLDIYVENEQSVSLLVLKDRLGKILSRALVWNCFSIDTNEEIILLDRIYFTNSWEENKMYEVFSDMFSDKKTITRKELSHHNGVYVNIKNTGYINYPYMDTLKYICIPKNNIMTKIKDFIKIGKRNNNFILTDRKSKIDRKLYNIYRLESTGGDIESISF